MGWCKGFVNYLRTRTSTGERRVYECLRRRIGKSLSRFAESKERQVGCSEEADGEVRPRGDVIQRRRALPEHASWFYSSKFLNRL
jgi:hypothetical protein